MDYLIEQVTTVRRRAAGVFSRGKEWVVIDEAAFSTLVETLLNRKTQTMPPSPSDVDAGLTPGQRAGLVLCFGVVNYCFVSPFSRVEYEYRARDGKKLRRTRGFYSALAESDIDWNQPASVEKVSMDHWQRILQTTHEKDLYQLDRRLTRLQHFAAYLRKKGLEQVSLLFNLHTDAGSLLRLLVESKLFEDEFLKRAQLTVYMLNPSARLLTGSPIPGLEHFTVMADYRLPQVFYNQGALKITSPALLENLQQQRTIPSGSRSERVLRAGTIVLGQRLAEALHMAESDVDHLLWEYSQELVDTKRLPIPHMLVATDKY